LSDMINKKTKSGMSRNKDIAIDLLRDLISRYGALYDPGSFGWFSLERNGQQIAFTRTYNIPDNIIYDTRQVSKKSLPQYSFTDLESLNANLQKCYKRNTTKTVFSGHTLSCP
jgi:hypothetical protein